MQLKILTHYFGQAEIVGEFYDKETQEHGFVVKAPGKPRFIISYNFARRLAKIPSNKALANHIKGKP